MPKIIICFQTTRRLDYTEILRLCGFLSKRSEYRDAYTIVPRYAFNERGFSFVRKPRPNRIVAKTFFVSEKSVEWPALTFHEANDIHAFTFKTFGDAPKFTEREIVFWLTCFELFGIVLAKCEKKWRLLLKHADVAEKLRNIPRPTINQDYRRGTVVVVLPHPDNKEKKCTLTKYMYSSGGKYFKGWF